MSVEDQAELVKRTGYAGFGSSGRSSRERTCITPGLGLGAMVCNSLALGGRQDEFADFHNPSVDATMGGNQKWGPG